MKPPVVVIGAGVNELVAAHCLARAGLFVTVVSGGDAAAERSDSGWVPPNVARELGIDANELAGPQVGPWAVAPLAGGGRLELTSDVRGSAEAIGRLSARDAAKWPAFCESMHRYAGVVEALYTKPPPDPLAHDVRGLALLARDAWRVRGLGRSGMQDFMRLLPMSVADFLDDWFECDALKGILGAAGVMHAFHGPRSGGTAFNLLHHHVGSAPGVFRPPASRLHAVLSAREGLHHRRGHAARVLVSAGRVSGVALGNGEMIEAGLVVAGCAPERALLGLIDPGVIDPQLARAVRHVRCRGVAAEIDLVLDRDPGFSRLVIAPALDYLERAYDDAKYGRVSADPYIEARVRGTGGGRVDLRVHVQYVPYTLRDGVSDTDGSQALGRRVIARIAEVVSGFELSIIEYHVLTPHDLERVHGYPEGQAYHAELALDQILWMRPLPELAHYATPIGGFYLCGPAMHPGAGIAGAAGANAASVMLGDLKRGALTGRA
jgi:phytoene dehydrogenase-like protein